MASESASVDVVTEKLARDAPPPVNRDAAPPPPIVSCTVSTPSLARMMSSTCEAASPEAASVRFGSSACVTVKLLLPVLPRKLVFMSGARAPVRMRMSNAAPRVMKGRRRVHPSTGS